MLYKRIFFAIILSLGIIFFANSSSAADEKLNLYIFTAEGCPHCADEKVFLEKMEDKYSNLVVHELEITKNEENRKSFQKTLKKLEIKNSGVPLTIIGGEHFVGFGNEKTTGALIEKAIKRKLLNEEDVSNDVEKINIPIIGELNVKSVSLPALTIIIGILDGFNPCAMWVLIFLITLLLGMKDRRRMWIFGSVFIIASAAVYFLFMTAWLNFFLFVGFIPWVRTIIAIVALGTGIYYLRDYHINKEGECKVGGGGKKKKIFDKLREIIHEKTFWWALLGIIMLAFAVNLVELICSAGLPAIYTQVLTLSDLPTWQYYTYILFYIFFFMLDDIVVFAIAMVTLKAVGIQGKYSRYSRLFGGIIMLILGLLLAFKPEWLMFG